MNIIVKALALSAMVNGLCAAQDSGVYTEWLSTTSNMNWSSGMVTAEGFGVAPEGKREEVGRLLACRAAVTDAQRNLLEATKGVRVTVSTSVSKYAADYDTVKTAVDGSIRGASILSRDMGQDNTCKVTMGLFVAGELSSEIYEKTLPTKSSAAVFFERLWGDMWPKAYAQSDSNDPFAETAQQGPWMPQILSLDERVSKLESGAALGNTAVSNARSEAQPTGLIIDVRGHRFLPSMAPEIVHPQGEIVYPTAQDRDSIVKSGKLMSLFSRSLDFALNHPIVGDKPLLIKGAALQDNATRIQLTEQNADKLMALAKQSFFTQPRIIIVLD
jgi:hypothetical protein